MITLKTKWNQDVKIFTDNIEESALAQVIELANSPLGEGANIRIMPDVHAGAGCVIGTTMQIKDKVCPNLAGVDLGCGVSLQQFVDIDGKPIDFSVRWEELDAIIRRKVPFGRAHKQWSNPDVNMITDELRCWKFLSEKARDTIQKSLGTLGGGWR